MYHLSVNKLQVTKYSSSERGLLDLRYAYMLYIQDQETAWIEFTSYNGRKCKTMFCKDSSGYLTASLALKDKTRIGARLHRLIWSNIKGKIPVGCQLDHIDRNKLNNDINNLRIVTPLENCRNRQIEDWRNGGSKLTEQDAREILVSILEHKKTRKELAKEYNISFSVVKAIRSGRAWIETTKDIFKKYDITEHKVNTIITAEKAKEILQDMLENKITVIRASAKYNVNVSIIKHIRDGSAWYKDTKSIFEQYNIKLHRGNTAILTEEQVRDIAVSVLSKKLTCTECAKKYNVTKTTISRITLGKSWQKVTLPIIENYKTDCF